MENEYFDVNELILEEYNLAEEFGFDFFEVQKDIVEAYEDMMNAEYAEIDRLYW